MITICLYITSACIMCFLLVCHWVKQDSLQFRNGIIHLCSFMILSLQMNSSKVGVNSDVQLRYNVFQNELGGDIWFSLPYMKQPI